MKKPLLTIITAVRNDQAGLNRTIESVRNELPFAEHLIVDGSNVPLEIPLDLDRIFVMRGRDKGISHAFNKGVLNANGEFLIFINAGDSLVDKMGSIIHQRLQISSADCLWFSVYRQKTDGKLSIYRPRLRWLRYAMSAPHQGMIVKKEVFAEIGLFPQQRYSMDHYFAAKLMVRRPGYKIECYDEAIAYYPTGGHSTMGGLRPFVANCWNVARVDIRRLPLAIILNSYLALKSLIF